MNELFGVQVVSVVVVATSSSSKPYVILTGHIDVIPIPCNEQYHVDRGTRDPHVEDCSVRMKVRCYFGGLLWMCCVRNGL